MDGLIAPETAVLMNRLQDHEARLTELEQLIKEGVPKDDPRIKRMVDGTSRAVGFGRPKG
jgi:hypothetical protein